MYASRVSQNRSCFSVLYGLNEILFVFCFLIFFVQLVDKDPERAIPLFWAAINAGDRVDSALKDMAIVMKQQNRAEEAIEAIKSLRSKCSDQAQESLDNILLDLFKVIHYGPYFVVGNGYFLFYIVFVITHNTENEKFIV